MKPKSYVENAHSMLKVFLSDETYAEAISAMVFVTSDAVIVNRERKTFYLAKRRALPMAGWWWIGGRVYSSEPANKAIARIFKRETELDIPANRFKFMLMQRYIWSTRQQEPQEVGSDCLSYIHIVELYESEIESACANLDPKEYDASVGLQEFTRDELAEINAHDAIQDMYITVFPSDT
jgi:ADP-ribose pyrophosphatase YjhB (NUDIX family)